MNLKEKILEIIKRNPNGIKASDIAKRIGASRKEVNSALYGKLKGICYIDNNYYWYIRQEIKPDRSNLKAKEVCGKADGNDSKAEKNEKIKQSTLVVEKEKAIKQEKIEKKEFYISEEDLKNFEYSDEPLLISDIVSRINKLIDIVTMKKLETTKITNWLMAKGFLEETVIDNKRCRIPSKEGDRCGLLKENRKTVEGEKYIAILYPKAFQYHIIKSISIILFGTDDIRNQENSKKDKKIKVLPYVEPNRKNSWGGMSGKIKIEKKLNKRGFYDPFK